MLSHTAHRGAMLTSGKFQRRRTKMVKKIDAQMNALLLG